MPRVHIKKKDYMKSDFSASIVGKLYKENLVQSDLAREMNITQQALSRKIRAKSFSMDDLMVIFKVLNYSDEEIVRYLKT